MEAKKQNIHRNLVAIFKNGSYPWKPRLSMFMRMGTTYLRCFSTAVSVHCYIHSHQEFVASAIAAIFLLVVASLCICLQPYKQKHSNDLTAGLLLILGFVATGHSNSQETDIANRLTTLFLLVPHTVLREYVIWRGGKNHCLILKLFEVSQQ